MKDSKSEKEKLQSEYNSILASTEALNRTIAIGWVAIIAGCLAEWIFDSLFIFLLGVGLGGFLLYRGYSSLAPLKKKLITLEEKISQLPKTKKAPKTPQLEKPIKVVETKEETSESIKMGEIDEEVEEKPIENKPFESLEEAQEYYNAETLAFYQELQKSKNNYTMKYLSKVETKNDAWNKYIGQFFDPNIDINDFESMIFISNIFTEVWAVGMELYNHITNGKPLEDITKVEGVQKEIESIKEDKVHLTEIIELNDKKPEILEVYKKVLHIITETLNLLSAVELGNIAHEEKEKLIGIIDKLNDEVDLSMINYFHKHNKNFLK